MVTQPAGLGGDWVGSQVWAPACISVADEKEMLGPLEDNNGGVGMLDLSSWKALEMPNKGHKMRPSHSKGY